MENKLQHGFMSMTELGDISGSDIKNLKNITYILERSDRVGVIISYDKYIRLRDSLMLSLSLCDKLLTPNK